MLYAQDLMKLIFYKKSFFFRILTNLCTVLLKEPKIKKSRRSFFTSRSSLTNSNEPALLSGSLFFAHL